MKRKTRHPLRQGVTPLTQRVIHGITQRMTMLSFRVDDETAARTGDWAAELGVDRSELLREALRRHLARLGAERDAEIWEAAPLTVEESSLQQVSDWGPAEDWSDWGVDAAG